MRPVMNQVDRHDISRLAVLTVLRHVFACHVMAGQIVTDAVAGGNGGGVIAGDDLDVYGAAIGPGRFAGYLIQCPALVFGQAVRLDTQIDRFNAAFSAKGILFSRRDRRRRFRFRRLFIAGMGRRD